MKHILRLVNHCKNTITSTQPTFLPWYFGLYQRPSSEDVCSIPLPVLATIVMRRGKKSVVRVAQRVAPLIPVQRLPSFFSNMYCLFDPYGTFIWFSVQNSGGRPIDHVVVMTTTWSIWDSRAWNYQTHTQCLPKTANPHSLNKLVMCWDQEKLICNILDTT